MIYDFADINHAQGYLIGGIVRVRNKPCVIKSVNRVGNDDLSLTVLYLGTKRQAEVMIEEMDDEPVPIGMINIKQDGHIRDALYLARCPERRWKVGLMQNACQVHPVRKGPATIFGKIKIGQWWTSDDMKRCVLGKYPSFLEAAGLLARSKERSIAFSRGFAITGNGELMYRCNNKPIGTWDGVKCFLFAEYELLIDQLMEDSGGQANIA